MIKDFLIIKFTGNNDSIGLRVNNNFFVKKIQTNIKKNNGQFDEKLAAMKIRTAKMWSYVPGF